MVEEEVAAAIQRAMQTMLRTECQVMEVLITSRRIRASLVAQAATVVVVVMDVVIVVVVVD